MPSNEANDSEPDLRVVASLFRKSGEACYPGVLLTMRPGSMVAHPTEDNAIEPKVKVFGVALWGREHDFERDMVAIKPLPDLEYARYFRADLDRPSTGNPVVDAWIIRADALRRLLLHLQSVRDSGETPSPLYDAAAWEIFRLTRETAQDVLDQHLALKADAANCLVQIIDLPTPHVPAITAAIREVTKLSVLQSRPSMCELTPMELRVWKCLDNGIFWKAKDIASECNASEQVIRNSIVSIRAKRGPEAIINQPWFGYRRPDVAEP